MAIGYQVPGVYFEPRRRAVENPVVRTDVVGFIGFDPRVRDGSTPSSISVSQRKHSFQVDIASFQIHASGVRGRVLHTTNFLLSETGPHAPGWLLDDGQSVIFNLAARGTGSDFTLQVARGMVATSGSEQPPLPGATGSSSVVFAHVTVRRHRDSIFVTSRPAVAIDPVSSLVVADFSLTRCDDWRDYVLVFGEPPDDGTLLGPAVRAFFANGGRRCWITTVQRPSAYDAEGLRRAREDMIGIAGASEREATGLERLLLLPEVTIVDAPDLHALRASVPPRIDLPARDREACFLPCRDVLGPAGSIAAGHEVHPVPLYERGDILDVQRALLRRCGREHWRVLLLLSAPQEQEPTSGRVAPPSDVAMTAWVEELFWGGAASRAPRVPTIPIEESSCAALYWPWVQCQEPVTGRVFEMPPTACVAGVIARRDLSRGPEIAPANETLKHVVGLAWPVDDHNHGALYTPEPDRHGERPASVNVLRPFPGYGIQVWGARTASTDRWLRYLSVRRTLTAIELRMKAALEPLVFEPNTPALWFMIAQAALGVLVPIFEKGALRGERHEDAFRVRCDSSVNPPEAVEAGRLVVEVSVAVAAPAEFITFRLGRREGVVEVME